MELWSAPCCGEMAGNVIVRQDVLCLRQRLHRAARLPAHCLHTQAGSARRPGRHSAPDHKCRSRAGACKCMRGCAALRAHVLHARCAKTSALLLDQAACLLAYGSLGQVARCCVAVRGRCEAVQHAAAAVSAPAPPAEHAVSGADAVFPLYKRLQNGSDIRGVAVEGER